MARRSFADVMEGLLDSPPSPAHQPRHPHSHSPPPPTLPVTTPSPTPPRKRRRYTLMVDVDADQDDLVERSRSPSIAIIDDASAIASAAHCDSCDVSSIEGGEHVSIPASPSCSTFPDKVARPTHGLAPQSRSHPRRGSGRHSLRSSRSRGSVHVPG
jgi:hypothetical protein